MHAEDYSAAEEHQPHQIFSELEELVLKDDGLYEWKETARWVKFEEDVEEGSNRWSKPHVSSLSMHSLMELRNMILKGTVYLDLEADNLDQILDVLLENVVHNGLLTAEKIGDVKLVIMKKHRHQFEGLKKEVGNSFANRVSGLPMPKIKSFGDLGNHNVPGHNLTSQASAEDNPDHGDHVINNAHFKKKLPKDAEAAK